MLLSYLHAPRVRLHLLVEVFLARQTLCYLVLLLASLLLILVCNLHSQQLQCSVLLALERRDEFIMRYHSLYFAKQVVRSVLHHFMVALLCLLLQPLLVHLVFLIALFSRLLEALSVQVS